MAKRKKITRDNRGRIGESVNRGNVGRAASCVAMGDRGCVGTGVGRGSGFRQRLWDGKVFLRMRLTGRTRS